MNWAVKEIKINLIKEGFKLELPVSSSISYSGTYIEKDCLYVTYLNSGFKDTHIYDVKLVSIELEDVVGYTLLATKGNVSVFCKLIDLRRAK